MAAVCVSIAALQLNVHHENTSHAALCNLSQAQSQQLGLTLARSELRCRGQRSLAEDDRRATGRNRTCTRTYPETAPFHDDDDDDDDDDASWDQWVSAARLT
jgi:hypothetical protein